MARPLLIALFVLAIAAACTADQEAGADPPESTTAEDFPTVTLEPSTSFTDTERAANGTAPRTAIVDCSTRSFGEFPGAFEDPANLVIGPFLFGGGGLPTEASVIEELGGQKFAVLLRAGHTVTVQVPARTRSVASLGWGPLPQGDVGFADGYQAVRFSACPNTLTFWPGFVFAREPACVPLEVYVGNLAPRRVEIELGAAC